MKKGRPEAAFNAQEEIRLIPPRDKSSQRDS